MISSRTRSVLLLLLVSLCPAFADETFADLYADLCSVDTVNLAGWQALAAAKLVAGGLGKKMVWPTAKTDAKKDQDAKTLTTECTKTYHAQEGMFFLRAADNPPRGIGCCGKCWTPTPFGIGGCHDGLSCQVGRCLPAGAMGRFGEGAKKVLGGALWLSQKVGTVGLAIVLTAAAAWLEAEEKAEKAGKAKAAKAEKNTPENAKKAELRAKIELVNPPEELRRKIKSQKGKNSISDKIAYRILGVDRFSTAQEIKSAARELSRANHPDKHDPGDKEFYEAKMVKINEAKGTLEAQIQHCYEIGDQKFHDAKKANQELEELLRKR